MLKTFSKTFEQIHKIIKKNSLITNFLKAFFF